MTAGQAGTSSIAYLAIKYAECLARPVQAASSGCGCDSDPCQYSRIVDSFQLQCMAEAPAQPQEPKITLCQANSGTIAARPPCLQPAVGAAGRDPAADVVEDADCCGQH